MDLSDMPTTKKLAIGAGALAVLLILIFAVNAIFFAKKQEATVKVKPPPGFPDIAPYNTKSWQDMQRKTASQGAVAPMPPPVPGGPPR